MNNNDWLDIDVLEDYLDGKLDAKTMHRVERLSLEDPFVAEALAGLSLSPKRVQSLSLLQKQLQDRIAQKPVEKKRWQITSQRLSIAAAAAVLFVTVSVLFWMRENSNREQIVANTPKKVDVAIAAKQAPEKPSKATTAEMDKVIVESKTITYANNSKKVADKPAKSVISAFVETPPAEIENASKDVSLRSIEIQEKKEGVAKQIASALAGKVAGVQINRNLIKGVVYGEDKLPISGASVKLKGAIQGAITDGKGQFSLALDSTLKNPTLDVGYLGFMPKQVSVKKNENVAIELKQDNAALNEVVITGFGSAKKQAPLGSVATIVKAPEPIGGWDKFEDYMANNNQLLVDKKLKGRDILVNFKINEKGEPYAVKIGNNPNLIPKPTKAEEKEAIRLLKEGPKWFLPNSSSALKQTSVNIRF